MRFILLAAALTIVGCATSAKKVPTTSTGKQGLIRTVQSVEEKIHWEMISLPGTANEIRAGYYLEQGDLKGCVLFLQGFGDSAKNHFPLYEALSQAGFRTITYDYFGQGGSHGRMNSTRVVEPDSPGYEIVSQAKQIWQKYSDESDEHHGRNCSREKKLVIGWSTGGLAAYYLAKEKWADAVALIAPGIHPNKLVGAAASNPLRAVYKTVTVESLTRNRFKDQESPFKDPISPNSPVLSPFFTKNLLTTANASREWTIDKAVKGVVFLGGGDTYVDSASTVKTLEKNASHFKTITYPGALHSLDNELPEVASDVRKKIVKLFSQH